MFSSRAKPPKTIIVLFRKDVFDPCSFEDTELIAGVFDLGTNIYGENVYHIRSEQVNNTRHLWNERYFSFGFDNDVEEKVMLLRMKYPDVPLIRFTEHKIAASPGMLKIDFSMIPETDPVEFMKLDLGQKTVMLR